MRTKENRKQSNLRDYLDTMRFLNADSDVSMYIYDLAAGLVYFADNFDEKYHLPPMRNGAYTIRELMSFLKERDTRAPQTGLLDLPPRIQQLCHREYWLTAPNADPILIKNEIRLEYSDSGRPCWVIGRLRDASAGRNIDSLTGLFDEEKLMEDLNSCKAKAESGYLMILGIDNFRDINTLHGRGYGNQIIRSVADILEEEAPASGNVYRLDSDKFAIHIAGGDQEGTDSLYRHIQKRCSPICTLSAGAAKYTADPLENMDEIYQRAENMLSLAKQQGKNVLLFFSQAVFERQLSMLDLQAELKDSVANGFQGFFLTYQPQINCKSYEIFGAEALLRFQSPNRGLVRPDEFMPILEKTGMIIEVGAWVLETALNQCRQWREQLPDLHISVNVSYIQLREKDVAERFLSIVERSGIPGSAITLEVTESMQLQDFQRYNKIFYKLEKHGIQIAIDDFGTGYSSLSYLKRIAIDEIKIDRCFVSRIQHSAYNYRLLSNMIELARSAQIRVCCEGVETEQELSVLMELSPDLVQGYLFAKPYDVEQFAERYITPGSDAYSQCRKQEAYYRAKGTPHTESMERTAQERLSDIVDGMDELVYVRSLDSYELLYLNAAGREITGMYDYKGCKCYKVLMDRNSPCESCPHRNLNAEEYRVREKRNPYLKRHFMLKEKLIPWQGQMAGLAIAIDVTEKEITTKRVQEKLEFEKNIVDCTQMLLHETDLHTAITNMLRSIATFYRADRAYVFQLQDNKLFWDNTYEWCAEAVESQIESLQDVPISATRRWQELFRKGESIVIEDVEALREISPEEWEILSGQSIRNMIVSPLWKDNQVIGFIGVDNPKAHAGDCGQVQTIAYFLADRILKDETKGRLNELLNLHYEDILKTTNLGLWVIRISKDGSRKEMYVDQTMRNILGIRGEATAEECYHHWYHRINEGYFHYVNYSVQHMIDTGKTVELSYTWNHPVKGEVTVRCLGTRVADMGDMICLEGYHREINEVDRPGFLPDAKSIIFEYNENKRSVYFHNSRASLSGNEEKEENFPDCWLESGMVHPHFAEQFRSLFTDVQNQPEQEGQEFLLKSVSGAYDWFKLKTRHLGQDVHDSKTMIVILDPAKQERAMELEFLRQKEFYGAILAEKIAYAEIDMESHRFLTLGGLWSSYADAEERNKLPYEQVLLQHADLLVHPEDLRQYQNFFREDTLHKILSEQKTTEKIEFRRLICGEMRWVELTGHVFQDQVTGNFYALVYMKDIDAKKRRELDREIAATRDPLTKVYNRITFEEEVAAHMLDGHSANSGTLLLLDMDNFKEINDTFGHGEGDLVLRTMSDILMSTFRRKDLIGRFGGDEFLVFLKNVTDKEVIFRRLKELRGALENVHGHKVTCSVGATVVSRDSFSYDECLQRADIAMYRSKENGRDTYCYFEDL